MLDWRVPLSGTVPVGPGEITSRKPNAATKLFGNTGVASDVCVCVRVRMSLLSYCALALRGLGGIPSGPTSALHSKTPKQVDRLSGWTLFGRTVWGVPFWTGEVCLRLPRLKICPLLLLNAQCAVCLECSTGAHDQLYRPSHINFLPGLVWRRIGWAEQISAGPRTSA